MEPGELLNFSPCWTEVIRVSSLHQTKIEMQRSDETIFLIWAGEGKEFEKEANLT